VWIAIPSLRETLIHYTLPVLPAHVGVGIMIAHDPLLGSGRADFPHPALTSGDDAQATQRKRMIHTNLRQPVV